MIGVGGHCDAENPDVEVDQITVSLREGAPDPEEVRSYQPRRAEARQAAAEQAAHQAGLSKLPVIGGGTPGPFFVGSDRKCAEQFQGALTMDGLEKRKRVSELISYGCGFLVSGPLHVSVVRKEAGYSLVRLAEGEHSGELGWVPTSLVK